jgi:hypothetical protein
MRKRISKRVKKKSNIALSSGLATTIKALRATPLSDQFDITERIRDASERFN